MDGRLLKAAPALLLALSQRDWGKCVHIVRPLLPAQTDDGQPRTWTATRRLLWDLLPSVEPPAFRELAEEYVQRTPDVQIDDLGRLICTLADRIREPNAAHLQLEK